jgi:hypothetical protein
VTGGLDASLLASFAPAVGVTKRREKTMQERKISNNAGSNLFPLGDIVTTRGVLEVCTHDHLLHCLARHAKGDWGNVCKEDAATNNAAVKNGDRILSAYAIDPAKPAKGYGDNCLWIITEADRSVTTFLLPSEY